MVFKASLGDGESVFLDLAALSFKMEWFLCQSFTAWAVPVVVAGSLCPGVSYLPALKTSMRSNCPSFTPTHNHHGHLHTPISFPYSITLLSCWLPCFLFVSLNLCALKFCVDFKFEVLVISSSIYLLPSIGRHFTLILLISGAFTNLI